MTTTKRVVKKTVDVSLKEYHIVMKLNDEVFEKDTDNLMDTIMEFKPRFLKTKVTFKITRNNDGKTVDKLLFVRGAKMIFRNALSLKIFVSRLIFK